MKLENDVKLNSTIPNSIQIALFTFVEKEVKSIYSLLIRNFKYLSIGSTIEAKGNFLG